MIQILNLRSTAAGSPADIVASEVIGELQRTYPGARITIRDLADAPLEPIGADFVSGVLTPTGVRSDVEKRQIERSDALIGELLAADIVVIGVAMINFSIPATLKVWIDQVTRAGRTFAYTEGGPRGLVAGKQVILVTSHTGLDASARRRKLDHGTPYLRQMLAFLGMTDIELIAVEATVPDAEAEEKAVASGREHAVELVRDLVDSAPSREGQLQALVSF